MKKLTLLVLAVLLCATIAGAEEDDGWICFGGNATICSQAYVRCVAQFGGSPDPDGSGSTLCEARYENCLESGGGCLPIE
jgi:hypothetical protein